MTSAAEFVLDLTRDDHAYFFGFLQTDGHLHMAKTGRKGQLSVSLAARDEHILWEFKRIIYPLKSTVSRRRRATNFAPSGADMATWTACDYGLRRQLQVLGLPAGAKSSIIEPPAAPFDRRAYLRGLVDGDGAVGFQVSGVPYICLVSASRAIVEHFCRELMDLCNVRRAPARVNDVMFNVGVLAARRGSSRLGYTRRIACRSIASVQRRWSLPTG